MVSDWAHEEFDTLDLDDKRLNDRLTRLISDLARRPTASIPQACGGHAETTAAYRLFDNPKVTFAKILEPHFQHTRQRVAAQPVALLVQDTTELDLTRPASQVAGAGPMDGSARRGAFLHVLHAFTDDGTPLGTAWAQAWTRQDEPEATAAQKRERRRAAPLAQKESQRWVEGLRQARAVAEAAPGTTCVCIDDSEADIYELFTEPRDTSTGGRVEWLIRACQDRGLAASKADDVPARLRAAAEAAPGLFTQEISVRGRSPKIPGDDRARRQARQDRTAMVRVHATTVTLRPPHRPTGPAPLPPVSVHVVLVREDAPPAGEEPIEWLLVTTLPINDAEAVRTVIASYSLRWMIEIVFRTLKSGCRVEERRFEHVDRLLPCVAVYLIVAWRTLLVCWLGRGNPELDCEVLFAPEEWKSVYAVTRRKAPPARAPELGEMVRLVAQLGGYVNRPNRKDPPGVQTVWQGLQRMHDLALAWATFGPGSGTELM
jgi:hypothetical protein